MIARPMTLLRVASLPLVALLVTACTAEIEVQTTPMDIAIPVTSVGLDGFAELAIPMPEEARGSIIVVSVAGEAFAVNASDGTTLQFQLFVLPAGVTGTATPETPFLFTEANPPAYFAQALPLVPATTFGPGTRTRQAIANPGLAPAVRQETMWLVAANTVSSVGVGDVLPLELQLEGLTFNVIVTKSFESSAGGMELLGL